MHFIAHLFCKIIFQNAIHNHIRLFEPLVIKALKQYTTSTSVALQRQVLDLLAQLVQLRVNYCLLDSDQVNLLSHTFMLEHASIWRMHVSYSASYFLFKVFIGFVLKQFEYIEVGQFRQVLAPLNHLTISQCLLILTFVSSRYPLAKYFWYPHRDSEAIIPNIFFFLVLLSYERYHSKQIISIPKIIQLCDGIMASGRKAVTHGKMITSIRLMQSRDYIDIQVEFQCNTK